MEAVQPFIPEPLERLKRDIRKASATMAPTEARYLVDLYYQIQEFRKATNNQIASMSKAGEPVGLIGWSFASMKTIEMEIKRCLDLYTDNEKTGMGAWSKSIIGIGPVISAGLLAHIDISKATTAASIWRFAGLDPTSEWKKGEKRPWNARLKVLCWKMGESFVKQSGNEKCLYGKLYHQRKEIETAKNDARQFEGQAEQILAKKRIGKKTVAYKSYSKGLLPLAHVHARAQRWAVKVFLCHYFEESYRRHYGKEPPTIYSIAMLGHVHKIEARMVD